MEKHCLKNDSNAMRHKSCKKTRFHVNSEMKLLALNDFCKQYYSILKYLSCFCFAMNLVNPNPITSCLALLLQNLSHHLLLLQIHLRTLRLLLLFNESKDFHQCPQFMQPHILKYHLCFIQSFN